MGTPLLSALRSAYPAAHITWIAESREAQAILANPDIDEVVLWDTDGWKRLQRLHRTPILAWRSLQFLRNMRSRRFDIFISLEPERWPKLLFAIDAATTIGIFDTFGRFYGAPYRGSLTGAYTHAFTQADLPEHRTDQYLLALDALELPKADVSRQMTLGYTEEDRRVASRFLRKNDLAVNEFIVLAPSTTWTAKCWPVDRYARLANELAEDGYRIVLTGTPKESGLIDEVAGAITIPPVNAVGQLSFSQLAAVVDDAALLVSGDTGPMHVASAVKTPYVALFGPTASKWYGPRDVTGIHLSHPVPCGPCEKMICPNGGEDHHICMRLLTIDNVLAASRSLLPLRISRSAP